MLDITQHMLLNYMMSEQLPNLDEYTLFTPEVHQEAMRYHEAADLLRAENATLSERVYYDSLTDVLNRDGLAKYLETFPADKRMVVVSLDLKDFKHLNDTYGYEVGDEALVACANILTNSVRLHDVAGQRSHDAVARFGGDEFYIVTPSGKYAAIAGNLIRNRIETRANLYAQSQPHLSRFGISSGFAIGEPGVPFETTRKQAEINMKEHKEVQRAATGRYR